MKQTVVFDFDGVIHSYTSGWQGAVVIPDRQEQQDGRKKAVELWNERVGESNE